MGFTVRKAIDLGYLDKCTLLAGRSGLDRQIKAISVIEVPDGCSWIRGGELAVTALFGVKKSLKMQVALVENLAKSGGAGLVIFYTGRYMESLSGNLVNAAERFGLPLFHARDPDMTYADLIMPITEELALRRFSKDVIALTRSIDTGDDSEACDPIMGVLSERLGKSVVLLNSGFKKLEEYIPIRGREINASLIEMCKHKYESQDYRLINGGIVEIEVYPESTTMLLCKVKSSHNQEAKYLLIAEVPRGMAIRGSKAFVSIVLKLYEALHMQRKRIDRKHIRYQNDFIVGLLDGKLSSPDIIAERAKLLGLNMQDKKYIIIITGAETNDNSPDIDYISQALRGISPDSICLPRHNEIIVAPGCLEGDPHRSKTELITKLTKHINKYFKGYVLLGIGLCQPSFIHLRCSYNEAREAIRLYRALPFKLRTCEDAATIVRYRDVKYLVLAEQLAENPLNKKFGEDILKPVMDYDSTYGSELLDTMLIYIWEGLDTGNAAKKLFIHRNTLRYRLQTIRDLLKEDPFAQGNLPKYFMALCTTLFNSDRENRDLTDPD